MSFHIHGQCSRSEGDDLEEGSGLVAAGGNGFFHVHYPYLSERGVPASWNLFGCCTLMGLVNVLSISFTLAVTTTLRTSDIVLESNALLISTGFLISLFWRLHVSHFQPSRERHRASDELFSRAKLCVSGCLFTVMLSPVVACFPLLAIFWFFGNETFLHDTSGMPLVLSWVSVNTLVAFLIPFFALERETRQQGDSIKRYASLQEGTSAYDNSREGFFGEETKAAVTFNPTVSWKNTIESSEALYGLVRWAVSVPAESLQPSIAAEMLTIAAISIGAHLEGIDHWNEDVQYNYLVSQTCVRLAEVFEQADPSSIPDHELNVFLFVNRLEKFDGVDVTVLGSDSGNIPAGELKKIIHCLRSRSASSLGC